MGVVTARMASGALAFLSINWGTHSCSSPVHPLPFEFNHITGSLGEAYYVSGPGSAFLMLYDEPERAAAFVEGAPVANTFARMKIDDVVGHTRGIAEWLKLLRGEPAEVTTPGREGRATVEVAEAAYKAERSGTVIRLPITPEPWLSTAISGNTLYESNGIRADSS